MEQLERSVDSEQLEDRERHRTIASWIGRFLTVSKEGLLAAHRAVEAPEGTRDPDYMDFDSSSLGEEGVPPGTPTS